MGRSRIRVWLGIAAVAMFTVACAETDPGVTTAVKAKLAADDTVKAYRIDVDTQDKVVTLKGEVDTAGARTRAVELAKTTAGVRDVVDQLVVKDGITPPGGLDDAAQAKAGEVAQTADAKTDNAQKKAGEAVDKAGDAVATAGRKAGDAADKAGDKIGDAASNTAEATADAAITALVKTKFLADSSHCRVEDRRGHEGQRRHAQRHRGVGGGKAPRRRSRPRHRRCQEGGRSAQAGHFLGSEIPTLCHRWCRPVPDHRCRCASGHGRVKPRFSRGARRSLQFTGRPSSSPPRPARSEESRPGFRQRRHRGARRGPAGRRGCGA